LTILLGAIAAQLIFPRLSIWEAGILAAILAPTDAGLGQVIVHSPRVRSEEHTSELQSLTNLVCRLLLEKKNPEHSSRPTPSHASLPLHSSCLLFFFYYRTLSPSFYLLSLHDALPIFLTILLGAIAAQFIFPRLSIWEAGILAAILAPTDAGLGQVIVHSPRVPLRIRQALDVEAGLNDGLSVPFLMFFIAVSQIGTTGAGWILLAYVVEQLGMGALVGGAIGLAGGWLLGQARYRGWMAESVQQLGLVTLPILSILACEPVGGSMFIAAYVAGIATQVGFKDVNVLSVEFTESWGQFFDYFVFFLFGLLVALNFWHFNFAHTLY